MNAISDEARQLEVFINDHFPKFETELEVHLQDIFPMPENKGLKHIWTYGSADLVVRRNGKLVAIFEPGGSHHWEEKQSLNDRRKWKLCDINGVQCLGMMNNVLKLSNRKLRRLIGRYLW